MMIEQAVIVAAGHGIGLGPLLKDRSKAMLPVLGKPVIVRLMDRMREAGIRRFVVVVDEHEGAVVSYLNTSWVPDVTLQVVLQTSPRGIVSALSAAVRYIDGPFLLAAGDSLAPRDHTPALLRRFDHDNSDLIVSVAPASASGAGDSFVVIHDGQNVLSVAESGARTRRTSVAFAMYACGKRVLNHLAAASHARHTELEMAPVVQGLLNARGKVGYLGAEWSMRLASELDLLAVNKYFLREGRDTHILSELPASVYIRPPVRIDPQVSIGRGAKIGPNVYLESGCHVGQDAVIWDSVVLRNAHIPDGEIVHNQIVTRAARIAEFAQEPDSSVPFLFE